MSLASFFESIPEKQRNLQLGLACDNPMSGAFPHKRVVHAGLNGTLISPKESQSVWDTVMRGAPKRGKCSVLIYIFHSARQNVRTVGSSKMVQVKVLKITILMASLGNLSWLVKVRA